MNDVYGGISAKNCYRNKRGQSETQTHLQILEQKMLPNEVWLAFSHNIESKQHLFILFLTYLCPDDFVQPSPPPILFNNKNKTFKVSF